MTTAGTLSFQENFITWKITDFFSLSGRTEIRSPEFKYKDIPFTFVIWPRGLKKLNPDGWFGIRLYRYQTFNNGPIEVSIMNGDKEVKSATMYPVHGTCANDMLMEWTEFVSRKDELAPNGVLTILCEMTDPKNNLENCTQHEHASNKVIRDLLRLLKSGKYADATLEVHGTKFPVHKIILAARSRRLASLFDERITEGSRNNFDFEDMDLETFSDFLHYLYTGCVENLNKSKVRKLYVAANKYDVHELKFVCEKYMLENIAVKNFTETLKFAVQFDVYKLLNKTKAFFKENPKKIVSSDKWMAFLKENPEIANEMFMEVL